jgi:hypothetical protein
MIPTLGNQPQSVGGFFSVLKKVIYDNQLDASKSGL